ncbi:hypothetical protein IAR55_001526 [Kwoniella newhampshirensis]|uniref:C2 NT-type domain-containing protein n=1 Tax=Kwoniella newhampshirensis TaxID=1651941 RepID=A0AAW0Z2E8_9TREE
MSDEDNGDLPSATPLDLLINAIAGSADYRFPDDVREGPEGNEVSSEGGNQSLNLDEFLAVRKVPAEQPGSRSYSSKSNAERHMEVTSSPSQRRLGKIIASRVIQSLHINQAGDDASGEYYPAISTVEVWHPMTGQKSYGKERRILNPPPILRVNGAALSNITSVTLSTIPDTLQTEASSSSGSQTHRIVSTLPQTPHAAELPVSRGKRAERLNLKRKLRDAALNAGFGATLPKVRSGREGKDRNMLRDGLAFPGLWVGEDAGKRKDFTLQLKLGQAVQSKAPNETARQEPIEPPSAIQAEETMVKTPIPPDQLAEQSFGPQSEGFPEIDNVHGSSLVDMLGSESMDVLQPLAEAFQRARGDQGETLAEHLDKIEAPTEAAVTLPVTSAPAESSDRRDYGSSAEITVATLVSSTLKIVSKPSQKTAKARSMASCLSSRSSFALWTRIHGQTVRTKYMKLEVDVSGHEPRLTSKTGKWSPFKFEVLHRAVPQSEKTSRDRLSSAGYDDEKLTYGSVVALIDMQTGTKSEPVKLVKVDSGEVRLGESDGDPVSELQRVGFVRMRNWSEDMTGDARWYLSAPGARLGGAEVADETSTRSQRSNKIKAKPQIASAAQSLLVDPENPPETLGSAEQTSLSVIEEQPFASILQDSVAGFEGHEDQRDATDKRDRTETEELNGPPKKKKKTKRNALAIAVVAEDEDGGVQALLSWAKAERTERTVDEPSETEAAHGTIFVEKVEDWMCWIIGGVSCFSTSFFSTADANNAASTPPVNFVPQILTPPVFHPDNNTLDLTLSEFFYSDPANPSHLPEPLEVYLGPLGPLHLTVWQSSARRSRPSDSNRPLSPEYARPYYDDSPQNVEQHVMSTYPTDKDHVIVVVEMPGPEDIIKAMQLCVAQAFLDRTTTRPAENDGGVGVTAEATDATEPQEQSQQPIDTPWLDIATTVVGEGGQNMPQVVESKTVDGSAPTERQHEEQQNGYRPAERAIAEVLSMTDNDFTSLHHLGPFDADVEEEEAQVDHPTLHSYQGIIDPSLRDDLDPTGEKGPNDPTSLSELGILNSTETQMNQRREPVQGAANPLSLHTDVTSETATNGNVPGMLRLYTPAKVEKSTEMMPLPLLLVRKHDGVVFGTGRSVVAQRLEGQSAMASGTSSAGEMGGNGNGVTGARWGLRVIET